jgi:pSer/pThr/pTyr-binding forkhead associated (FHA) protein
MEKNALPVRQLALRFISGKYQGGEFPLTENKEIVVGRSSELDMVLVEDMVSRRHARIACGSQQIVIEDLGSTNGTFVNGEKIKRATLKEGDRVLIGTSILKVVATDPSAPSGPKLPKTGDTGSAQRSTQARTMSGSIDEIPLPDLLQLFGTSKKSGVLVVRSEGDVGRIYLRKGTVYFASINDVDDIPALKSIYRILTWVHGAFDLEPPDDRAMPGEIAASVTEILMEGLRQIDELNAIRHKIPDLEARLELALPLRPALRDLAPADLDLLQLVLNHGVFSMVLNKSASTDLDTAHAILKLLQAGYLRAQ